MQHTLTRRPFPVRQHAEARLVEDFRYNVAPRWVCSCRPSRLSTYSSRRRRTSSTRGTAATSRSCVFVSPRRPRWPPTATARRGQPTVYPDERATSTPATSSTWSVEGRQRVEVHPALTTSACVYRRVLHRRATTRAELRHDGRVCACRRSSQSDPYSACAAAAAALYGPLHGGATSRSCACSPRSATTTRPLPGVHRVGEGGQRPVDGLRGARYKKKLQRAEGRRIKKTADEVFEVAGQHAVGHAHELEKIALKRRLLRLPQPLPERRLLLGPHPRGDRPPERHVHRTVCRWPHARAGSRTGSSCLATSTRRSRGPARHTSVPRCATTCPSRPADRSEAEVERNAPPGARSTDCRAQRAGAGRSAAAPSDADGAAQCAAGRRGAPIVERSEQELGEAQRRPATQMGRRSAPPGAGEHRLSSAASRSWAKRSGRPATTDGAAQCAAGRSGAPIVERSEQEPGEAQRRSATRKYRSTSRRILPTLASASM